MVSMSKIHDASLTNVRFGPITDEQTADERSTVSHGESTRTKRTWIGAHA